MSTVSVEINAPEILKDSQDAKCVIIDVRTAPEFESVHAIGAIHMPLDQISSEWVESNCPEDKYVALICKSGSRAKSAAEKIKGISREIKVVKGGTEAWQNQGLEVVEGESSVISLERQVRIAVGLLLISFVLASLWVPALIWMCFAIGCGLLFAGITDTCGLGLMIARMPWNKGTCGTSCNIA
ncbi:MAG: rhodanese-like domain-containing protein [Planctomycetes bacterium]|nr:rhodanese-like domain-containing protein [Planctomycetota bacterium]